MAGLKQPARGIMFARADAGSAAILAELQKTFEDFKAAHAEQQKGVLAKFDDVVTREKLDKVNATVGELQAALDATNAKLAAAQLGGGNGTGPRDAEYSDAFKAHFKTGEVKASLNKGVASEGGYLAPVEWDRTISDKLIIVSPMRSLASVMTIGGAGFTKLFNNRGTASGWVGETAARPETAAPAFGQMTYATGELYANPSATQQMLDDAEVNLEAWLAGEVETEFAYQEGIAFVSGNGVNKPNGILTYVTGGANAAAHPWGAIATVNSGAHRRRHRAPDLRASLGLHGRRRLRDEPEHAEARPPAEGRPGQLPVAAVLCRGPAGDAGGLRHHRNRGDAGRCGRGQADPVRRLRPHLPGHRPGGHPRSARPLHQQAVRDVLYHEARWRRPPEPGDHEGAERRGLIGPLRGRATAPFHEPTGDPDMAKLTKSLFAVPPGEIYPRDIPAGEECPADLEHAAREAGALDERAEYMTKVSAAGVLTEADAKPRRTRKAAE